jgi:hypothetical protein
VIPAIDNTCLRESTPVGFLGVLGRLMVGSPQGCCCHPKLRIGEGWIWAPDYDLLKHVKFPEISTLDTSKMPTAGDTRTTSTRYSPQPTL